MYFFISLDNGKKFIYWRHPCRQIFCKNWLNPKAWYHTWMSQSYHNHDNFSKNYVSNLIYYITLRGKKPKLLNIFKNEVAFKVQYFRLICSIYPLMNGLFKAVKFCAVEFMACLLDQTTTLCFQEFLGNQHFLWPLKIMSSCLLGARVEKYFLWPRFYSFL